jgi:hypothetical protein
MLSIPVYFRIAVARAIKSRHCDGKESDLLFVKRLRADTHCASAVRFAR